MKERPNAWLLTPGYIDRIFQETHLRINPRTAVPGIVVEFYPYVSLNHTARLEGGQLRVRVSDAFRDAPPQVCEALAWILLSKLYRRPVDRSFQETYREFANSERMRERSRRLRATRGRPSRLSTIGQLLDLELLFGRLNEKYFAGTLRRPALSWTPGRSRTVLGRYDSHNDVIFLSRWLDSRQVPEFVAEYVLYHEMLHVKHPSRAVGPRVVVHTREFRRDERRFDRYVAAQRWLKGRDAEESVS